MNPKILEIRIAEDKGEPMLPLNSIKAIEGQGLEGDRYATGKGAFSNSEPKKVRDISLIESEVIEAMGHEGLNVLFEQTRRNILTAGVRLNDLVGKRFKIGEVLVEGTQRCDPCARPGILSGDPELKEKLKGALENRGGLRVKILETGTINIGDEITI
jgi:MOSC domain-containing protein YiiM